MRSLKLPAILLHCILAMCWPSLAACSSTANPHPVASTSVSPPVDTGNKPAIPTVGSTDYAKAPPAVDAGQRIAVLIPLHGKLSSAGLAIQQGMLAAWYRQQGDAQPVPAILFLDSSAGDFRSVYSSAVASGAQLIIGPLEKQNLGILLQTKEPPVPTIALNYPDVPNPYESLYFLGLSGDDEAAQIARRMLDDGHRRPVVLLSSDDWAQRIGRHFSDRFVAAGGQPPLIGSFVPGADPGETVRKLLDVTAAQARHARLEQTLATRLAFVPSARRDVDSLFLVANTAQAAQLVPAIRYHGAQGLPVYATSHINSQAISSGVADDLSGVRFVETPWLGAQENSLRDDVRSAMREESDGAQGRLLALGVDAMLIADALAALRGGSTLNGMTGRLTLDDSRAIRRELDWMRYQDGKALREDEVPH